MPQGSFQPIYPNPYIVGNPIRSREMFFGRMDEFRFIERSLENGRKTALIVLFGERRSGKSSILYQLLNGQLGPAFLPIFVDMQIMAGIASEAELFSRIIADTCKTLGKNGPAFEQHALRSDESNPPERFRRFLKALKERFPQRSILLLIDEYEIFENKISEGCLSSNVLTFFAGLLESEQVSFVFTGSKKLELRDQNLWGGELLQKAVSRKISFLTKDDTARLITRPLAGKITFAPEVIAQIYTLTAGQPFYTQLICQNLVYRLNEIKKYDVNSADLHTVVENIIENPPPQMIFNWGEHSAERKLVLSLLAEFSEAPGDFLSAHDIRRGIKRHKLELVVSSALLNSVLADLFQDEYVLQKDHKYGFRLDLFRRWIRHDHNIWQVKKEIGAEELTRITKPAEQKAKKRKKAMTVMERSLLLVAVVAVGFLLQLLWNKSQKRDVIVQANGGPFQVAAVVDGDTVKFNANKKKDSNNKYSDEKKLMKGKTYILTANLPANNESQSKTVTIVSDTAISFSFAKYPVTVVTDAASMIATLGDTTIPTEGQLEPNKCTFRVCAGVYNLRVEDPNTGESLEKEISVSEHSDSIYISFDRVVVVLQAKLPFTYQYKSGGQNGYGDSKRRATSLYSEMIRGCKKGEYRFTFTNTKTQKEILKNYRISTDTTITVDFIDPPPPPPRPLPDSTYRLTIRTTPDSVSIILNNELAGYTPLFEKSVFAGRYSVKLEKEGYDPVSFQFELKRDTTISKSLTAQFGFLKVRVNNEQKRPVQDARVFVDGIFKGETPEIEETPIRLTAVKHQIEVTRRGFDSISTAVLIAKNETATIEIILKAKKK